MFDTREYSYAYRKKRHFAEIRLISFRQKFFSPSDWNWISPIALGIAIECLSKSIVRNKVKLFEMKTLDLHCDRARLEIRSNMIYFRSIGYCFLLLGRIDPHFRKFDTKTGEIFQLLIHYNFCPWCICNIFDLIYLNKLLNRRNLKYLDIEFLNLKLQKPSYFIENLSILKNLISQLITKFSSISYHHEVIFKKIKLILQDFSLSSNDIPLIIVIYFQFW